MTRKVWVPKEYQEPAVEHLTEHERCALWAGMGLGKTSIGLTYLSRLAMQGVKAPALVLAPTLVAQTTWPQESMKWEHLKNIRVVPILGTEKQRRQALGRDANVFTMNYENLPWLAELYGDRWPFKYIIADESTRLKNFRLVNGGQRAKALAKIVHSKVDRFVELTGTPAPNGLHDLWGQLWMLDAGRRLGRSYTAFKERWFRMGYDGFSMELQPHAEKEIHSKLSDICMTLKAEDWFDLEEPIVSNKYIELPAPSRKLYKEMEDQFFFEIENRTVEASNGAAKTQKLLQVCSGAVYVDPLVESDFDVRSKEWKTVHDRKIQVLESIITEAAGASVLVAYHFRSDAERLLKAFPKAVMLTKENVMEVMKDWNKGKIPILLAHPARAGHGLNLQDGGNIIVYFSMDWNLENRLQILERIGPVRQAQAGHKRPVFVYNILAQDTMDELVLARVETKAAVQDLLVNAMKKRRQ